MNIFFLLLEVFIYGFALYLLLVKKELALIYLPVLLYTDITITPVGPALAYYATITLLLASVLYRNSFFYRNNGFALLIAIYFLLLLPQSSDLVFIRPYVFGVIWFFLSVPLINAVYRKYSRDRIFEEISRAALLILLLFIANVLVSSVYKYSPFAMYGITSGVLYGNLYAVDFNILPIAIFISALALMKRKSTFQFVVLMVALAFVMLTLRRSVMGLSLAGVICAFTISMTQKNIRKVLVLAGLAFLAGFIIVANTGFLSQFNERYEMRDLENRNLEEEKRFIEYELIYRDMFVYKDYSPWFGFELFNSWGNYGRGVLGDRSLHSDLTNIVHSSGLVGLTLYLLMVATAFRQSYRSARTKADKLIFLFCAMTFMAFTTTGRYTETGYMLFLFLLLLLPLAKEAPEAEEVPALAPGHQVAA
jgi:O-antigen ligase